jgi:hypothetical protein
MKKHERQTRGIANKGFRGIRSVVVRFYFSYTLIGQSPEIPYWQNRHRYQQLYE